jgi:predicted AlkP superfamily phosphohydrolase/phosphomutase
MTNDRVLLIGLDGATFTILEPLMADGVMPFLRKFTESGAHGELMSTPNPLTPPAFTSLMTGRSPGYHGVYDFIRAWERDGSLYFTLINARDVHCETIWSIASRGERSITSLNFIAMYPPRPVNGYIVPGFVTSRHLKLNVHPPSLYNELKGIAQFDAKQVAWDVDEGRRPLLQGLSEREYEEGVQYQIRKERQWFEITRHLMRTHPCDLTAVVFDGVDKLQHLMWPFLDPALAHTLSASERAIGAQCREYFRELDGYLAELVHFAGPDTLTLFVSDHGFGPTDEIFYANTWLAQRGYLVWQPGTPTDDTESLTSPDLKRHYASIDWTRTTAYARTSSSNGIFIRVANRPDEPGIRPEQYQVFRAQLVKELRDYRDPVSGQPVIVDVLMRDDAFPGPHMAEAPDLTLVLRDSGFLSILNAPSPLKPRSKVSGTHRPEGILIAGGRGIRPSAGRLPRMSILDVAPTVLYGLGVPIPADFEGRVVQDIFDPAVLQARPPAFQAAAGESGAIDAEGAAMSDTEEAQVMERLKALGYL